MQLPFQTFFKEGVQYRTLRNLAVIFMFLLLIQLKYSMKMRAWTKAMIQRLIFGSTFFGLVAVLVMTGIKLTFTHLPKETKLAINRS